MTTETLTKLEKLRRASRDALDAYDENRCADTAQAHENANLVYFAELDLAAPALLAAARRLEQLESALEFLDRSAAATADGLYPEEGRHPAERETHCDNFSADGLTAWATELGWQATP